MRRSPTCCRIVTQPCRMVSSWLGADRISPSTGYSFKTSINIFLNFIMMFKDFLCTIRYQFRLFRSSIDWRHTVDLRREGKERKQM